MKKTVLTLLAATIIPLGANAGEMDHSSHNHAMHKKSEAIVGTGVIHTISRMNKTVNLTHDPIPALNWPEMTMDLPVAKDVDIRSLQTGTPIQFHLELGEDKVYRITKVLNEESKHNH